MKSNILKTPQVFGQSYSYKHVGHSKLTFVVFFTGNDPSTRLVLSGDQMEIKFPIPIELVRVEEPRMPEYNGIITTGLLE